VTIVGALLSALWRPLLWWWGASAVRLYCGTDTRADALLVGCTLGLLFSAGLIPGAWRTAAGALGPVALVLLLAGTAVLDWRAAYMFLGGYTVVALLAGTLLLHVVLAPTGSLARLFSLSPLAWIGKVSYGIYLWHVPVLYVVTADRLGPAATPMVLLVARAVVTLGLVVASYYLLERPFLRLKDRYRAREPVPGAA
jgi:peptidoglycan/LPS O-acetylase OafA/YrhL